MLNNLQSFIRSHNMIQPGDTVICAVSGGADSIGLLFGLYLLRDKLKIRLEAAHFNHHLRGEESDRDEAFVVDFCRGYEIPLHLGGGEILPGPKGLEAAARDARYAFLRSLPGKVATAHTANDNAETVLMHLIRGTGLKGLGGITPVAGNVIRPMLSVTRDQLLEFLHEYSISWVEDSSNGTDQFLRNRVRHHLMPLLVQENPCFAVNTSAMALRLREDEAALSQMAASQTMAVSALRNLSAACRSRALCGFLERAGVREPEAEHLALLERIVFSGKPSARASFPNGVTIRRNYDSLEVESGSVPVPERLIACPGVTGIPEIGLAVHCKPASPAPSTGERYFLPVSGALVLRQREEGDSIRLSGGTKSLKKLFIDKKIPAAKRQSVPILADAGGLLAVYGIGVNLDRLSDKGQWFEITFEPIEPSPIL